MLSPPHRYDIFVSYAQADGEWVEGFLLNALEAAGVRVLSEPAFQLGVPRLLEFERAVEQSAWVLLVLSPAYLAERYTQFVDVLAQSHGLASSQWRVLPLILRPVELPPRLGSLTRLDATQPAQHEAVIARLCKTLQAPLPAPATAPPCPYPGMRPFSESKSDYFYGREKEVAALLDKLQLYPFATVIGPSGSGKSSLVYAGLLPALRNSGLFGPGKWLARSVRPGTNPLSALTHALSAASLEEFSLPALLATEPEATRLLLVVDQFEELFTQRGEEHAAFFDGLDTLIATEDCYVVVTVRADFYSDLMTSTLWSQIEHHQLGLTPLDDESLRAAIVKPAERMGVFIEAALVERLVAHAAGEPGVLPFVQEILVRLWERLARHFLPLAAYETLAGDQSNGLRDVMAQIADERLHQLSAPQQTIARRTLLRLVQFVEGRNRDHIRRQQPVAALRAPDDDPALFEQTLHYLADHRLLTLGSDADGERLADISHEALLNSWPTLQHWIAERRDAEQTRRRLEGKAQEWIRFGRGEGGLLDATELAEAEAWLENGEAAELGGAGSDLRVMIEASRVAINPGWNRWGTVWTVLLGTALVSMYGYLYVVMQQIPSVALRGAIWLSVIAATGLLLLSSGILRQNLRYAGQHLSQSLASSRVTMVASLVIIVAISGLWGTHGVGVLAQERYCTAEERDYLHRGNSYINIAVSQEGLDPFYADIVSKVLTNQPEINAWTADAVEITRCKSFFDHTVILEPLDLEEGTGYRATVEPSPGEQLTSIPEAVYEQESCQLFVKLGWRIAESLDVKLNSVLELDEETHEVSCSAYQLNEQGYYSYREAFGKMNSTDELVVLDRAERDLKRAIENTDHSYALAHANLGLVYLYRGRIESLNDLHEGQSYYKRAAIEFQHAFDLHPRYLYVHDLGRANYNLNQLADAKNNLRQAIELNPNYVAAHINLAKLNRKQQMYADAIDNLVTAEELLRTNEYSESEVLFYGIAVVAEYGFIRYDQDQYVEALQFFDEALKIPSVLQEEIIYYVAMSYVQLNDKATACEWINYYREFPSQRLYSERTRRLEADSIHETLECI